MDHFSEHEQVDKGEEGRAYSTRDRCESVLNCWILPRWGKTTIDQIRTVAVEDWLRSIPRANGTKVENPQYHERALQPRHSVGVHGQESDHGPRPWIGCASERETRTHPRSA